MVVLIYLFAADLSAPVSSDTYDTATHDQDQNLLELDFTERFGGSCRISIDGRCLQDLCISYGPDIIGFMFIFLVRSRSSVGAGPSSSSAGPSCKRGSASAERTTKPEKRTKMNISGFLNPKPRTKMFHKSVRTHTVRQQFLGSRNENFNAAERERMLNWVDGLIMANDPSTDRCLSQFTFG